MTRSPDLTRWARVTHRDERRRLVRFGLVGISNGALAFAVFAILIAAGLPYLPAAVCGYAAGIVNGYTWNRTWTFQAGDFHLPEFIRYALVQLAGLALNVGGLAFAIETLAMPELVGELVALLPVVLATFFLNRWWIFRLRTGAATTAATGSGSRRG